MRAWLQGFQVLWGSVIKGVTSLPEVPYRGPLLAGHLHKRCCGLPSPHPPSACKATAVHSDTNTPLSTGPQGRSGSSQGPSLQTHLVSGAPLYSHLVLTLEKPLCLAGMLFSVKYG